MVILLLCEYDSYNIFCIDIIVSYLICLILIIYIYISYISSSEDVDWNEMDFGRQETELDAPEMDLGPSEELCQPEVE